MHSLRTLPESPPDFQSSGERSARKLRGKVVWSGILLLFRKLIPSMQPVPNCKEFTRPKSDPECQISERRGRKCHLRTGLPDCEQQVPCTTRDLRLRTKPLWFGELFAARAAHVMAEEPQDPKSAQQMTCLLIVLSCLCHLASFGY